MRQRRGQGKYGIWILIASTAFGLPEAQGHADTPPWLEPAALDNGLYVQVLHPRVIRNRAPFDLRVIAANVAATGDVTLQSVRYLFPPDEAIESHPISQLLPSQRTAYDAYGAARDAMHAAAHEGDVEAVHRLSAECRDQLKCIASAAFTDSRRIPVERIPDQVGKALQIVVEVQVVEGGHTRVIRRPLEIPLQPPLPNGMDAASAWRYDTRRDTATPLAAATPKPLRGDDVAWFAGDQHLHTTYSLDALVLNGTTETVTDYAATAELMGLDWIIVTDHSNVHVNWGGTDYYTADQFAAGAAQAAAYSAANPLLALYGEEMGAGRTGLLALPSHYLAYPFSVDSTGYLANPSSGLIFGLANCEPEQVIINRVNAAGGFGFIAHPFDSNATAFAVWNFNNGATGWTGLEIWSDTNGQIKSTDEQSFAKWLNLLNTVAAPQGGALAVRPDFPSRFPVGLGNSDAHEPGLIGATFTYAWMPEVSRPEVTNALVNGRCVASNGPLLFAELNGACVGEVALLLAGDGEPTATLTTTPEFGPVGDYTLTIYVNGVARTTVPPTGDPSLSVQVQLAGLNLALPDRYVVLRADSANGVHHAITNPVWLQFTAPGDADADGVIGPSDVPVFLGCLLGPDVEREPACDIMDFDRDRDVDLADFRAFQIPFTTP